MKGGVKMKQKVLWTIKNIEQIVASTMLLGMVALLTMQIVSRFIFNNSIPWTEELSRYAFLWLVYVAVSLVAKENGHIRIIDHLKMLPEKMSKILLVISDAIWILFNLVVVVEGFKLFMNMEQYPLMSAVLQWDLKYIFLIIPLSFLLASIRIVESNIKIYRNKEELPFDQIDVD